MKILCKKTVITTLYNIKTDFFNTIYNIYFYFIENTDNKLIDKHISAIKLKKSVLFILI